MPIYGYACSNCGHTLDALQKISDAPLVDCPECESPGLRRQLSAPRFRLKGQGWYETDFKSDKQRNLAGEAAAEKADGKSADKSGGDAADTTKPEKSPDTKTVKEPASKASKDKESAA